jgi:DnaJ-domain-containing protein 1
LSEKPPSPPRPEHTPPVLQRVPKAGAAASPTGPAPAPEPKPSQAPPATPRAPAASHGLAAPEVTAPAAIAAGIPAEGPLARESALHLYYLGVAAQATGRLALGGEKGSYALTFKKGVVEHAASTYSQDDLGQFLVRRGALDAGKLARAEEARASHGGDLVGALVALRLFDPAAQFQILQEHGAGLVWRALSVDAGTWRWEPGVAPPPSSFPLGSRWGMLCDAVRRLDAPGVRKRLGARAGFPAVRTGGRVALADLKLTSQESRAAGLFDGFRSPEEIAAAQPAEADLVFRLALLLGETELLGFAERTPAPPAAAAPPRPAAPPPAPKAPPALGAKPAAAPAAPARPPGASSPPSARPPAPAKPAAPPAAPAPAVTLASLRAASDRMKDADHFEVLGVRREATLAQIKASYFQLAKAYHPDSAQPDDAPEAKQLRADVFARIGEAWGVLGDDSKRAKYLEELASGGAADVDVMAILQAEQIFQLAAVLVKSRKYEEALKKLDECIQLNAEEPEFGIWKAWVEFLIAPADRKRAKAAESAAAIEAGLKKNPRCTPGYLFLGQMAKLVGDVAGAERHLKRGLAVDEKNVELQRELKYLKK